MFSYILGSLIVLKEAKEACLWLTPKTLYIISERTSISICALPLVNAWRGGGTHGTSIENLRMGLKLLWLVVKNIHDSYGSADCLIYMITRLLDIMITRLFDISDHQIV